MVTIRYFAAVRQMIGRETEEIELEELAGELEEPVTVGLLWEALAERHPQLEGLADRVRVAVNREFVDRDIEITEGDEVALIPPVSGGAGPGEADGAGESWERAEGRFRVTDEPISPEAVRPHVTRSEAGAVVTFEGVVRDHTDDHSVDYLEYECYGAMAVEKLVETAEAAVDQWPTTRTAIHHRYGHLEVAERAVVIAVSSPHRAEAFEACRFVIDRLKEVVPIWKKEVGPSGQEWVGWGP